MTQAFGLRLLTLLSATPATAQEMAVFPLRAPGLHQTLVTQASLPALYCALLLAILCLPRRPPTHKD